MNSSQNQQQPKKRESEGESKQSSPSSSATAIKQQLPQHTITPCSPPSSASSPSHEFTFTISLHPSTSAPPEKAKKPATTTPPSFAIDLSPADDIFFHGHLLPLHLLSHLPTSPRSSTNSLDSFTLPIRDILTDDQKPSINNNSSSSSSNSNTSNTNEPKERIKAKSFSFFRFSRWRKGYEIDEKEKKKNKEGSNISQIIRKYAGMVKPLLFPRGKNMEHSRSNLQRESYYSSSFSGNLLSKGKQQAQRGGRRGEFSAPASMWTSPTNSGLLLSTPVLSSSSSSSESTMEELQSAIQAAIAHCKSSSTIREEKQQWP